ncbi:uncharacterized protein [Montipora foliosa]|uniref:uncharacterized protein n=1 Tax=Montipora foliosa TaxID=591990 RepID=UPI0035F18A92
MLKTLLFLLVVPIASPKLTWRLLSARNDSDQFPAPRRDSSIGYNRASNQLIIFGGLGKETEQGFADTWIYDLAQGKWNFINTPMAAPQNRFSMVYGSSGKYFYVSTGEFGGDPPTFFNDIWAFNFTGQRWRRLDENSAIRPEVRYGSAGGIFNDGGENNGFYITHGFSGMRYSNTLKFDLKQNEWQLKFHGSNNYNPNYPHARCLHGGTMIKPDELVLYGGCLGGGSTGGPCPSKDNWKFDATKEEWTKLDECSTPRTYPSMAMLPPLNGSVRRVVLYGGQEHRISVLGTPHYARDEIAVLNPDTNEWKRVKVEGSSLPLRRDGHVMTTTDEGIVVFGGEDVENEEYLNDVWLLEGTASDADENPSAGSCGSLDFNLIGLHALFMFLGWGVCLQAGAFIARYFRHIENAWWFKMHRILQVTGLVLAFLGLVCAGISVPFDHLKFAHGGLGLAIMLIGLQQPLNARFRPHPPKENEIKTKGRFFWELFHKNLGRLALFLALINISLGFLLAVVPTAVWAVWFVLLSIYVIAHILMEVRFQMNQKKKNSKVVTVQMD